MKAMRFMATSVDDLTLVEIVQRESDLTQPVPQLILFEWLFPLSYFRVQISTFTPLHNYAQITIFVNEGVVVGDNAGVPQFLQQLDFLVGIAFLRRKAARYVNFLEHIVLTVVLGLH